MGWSRGVGGVAAVKKNIAPLSEQPSVDNLLPDHVGLPNVLDLAVNLVQLMTWMGWEVILRLFPFKHFLFMVKS